MGQFALGIRSLLIKSAVFVILAALLAWALGGTLFPRPEVARLPSIAFDGSKWQWKLLVGGKVDGEVKWELVRWAKEGEESPAIPSARWSQGAGLLIANDTLYAAGQRDDDQARGWQIIAFLIDGSSSTHPMPDRLAVEQQIERLRAGLPLQDVETILAQREVVLDPPAKSVDGNSSQ
jgi:hypothetical protein